MGWFEDQIKQREQLDQMQFDDSMRGLAAAVVGRSRTVNTEDASRVTRFAIDEILKYYRCKSKNIPEDIKDPEEQMDYCLRPHGLMQRKVKLEQGWHRDAFGPMIAYRKEDTLPVALIPGILGGYWYTDPGSGMRIRVTKRSASTFESSARCFYRSFPEGENWLQAMRTFIRRNILPADVVMFFFVALSITLAGLFVPIITRVLTGDVLEMGSRTLLIGTAQFLLCVLVSTTILEAAKQLLTARLCVRLGLAVEAAAYIRLLNLPISFFRNYSAGELAKRVQTLQLLSELLVNCVFTIGVTALFSILYTLQLVQFASSLLVPALFVLVLTALLSVVTALFQAQWSSRAMEYEAKASGTGFAILAGIQKIRLAGAERRAFAKWADVYAREASAEYDPPMFLKIDQAIITGVSLLGSILIYGLAIYSHVSPSEYLSFSAAYGMISVAFTQLAEGAVDMAQIRPIQDMAAPILQAKLEIDQRRNIVSSLKGKIEMDHVSFSYDEGLQEVIRDLSLKIRKGEYVAITGRSGCGKSTLLRLLLGLERPQRGSIYYDGHDIQTLDLQSLRRRIGTVIQNGSLVKGDIYSNIVIAAPHLSMEEAWKAAEVAQIAEEIREMPMGMHTMVTEGQGGLSGGQKQRLMIARAIASNPSVLFMDEATSNLDNITQKKISASMASLTCTRVVIAHRLSTIRQCDRILVMEEGRIVEEGSYNELIEQKGLFAELVERQQL